MRTRSKIKPLFRTIPPKTKRPLYAACDIETGLLPDGSHGLGGEYLDGCIRLEDKPGMYYHFRSIGKMLEFFANHPQYEFYFHNGSGYDFSYFIPSIYKLIHKKKATLSLCKQGKSRIIGLTLSFQNYGKSKKVVVKDSLPLLNMSLEKAAEFFAPDLPKLSGTIDWEHEVYDKSNKDHIAYLHRDVDALLAIMVAFSKLTDETFGTAPGWTAGSSAVQAWKAHIPEGMVFYRCHREVESFLRNGYYGGYVFPGHDTKVKRKIKSIDVNAMYARAMRKGVSVGVPSHDVEFQRNRPGMWRVIAHAPKNLAFPIIPSRDKNGFLKWEGAGSVFPTTVTRDEIVFAEKRGYTFEVIEGYWFYETAFPFDEFLEKCEQLELTVGGALKELAKLFRNALYGKFGTGLENDSLELRYDCPVDANYVPLVDEETGLEVPGIMVHTEENTSDYVMPMWAAEITSHARMFLFELIEAVGIEHVHYCDTDSVKGDAEAVDAMLATGFVQVKPGYGNVKIDEEYEWFQCLGTKNYRAKLTPACFQAILDKCPEAKREKLSPYIGKVKGIPKASLTILQHFLASQGYETSVSFSSVNNILARLKDPSLPISTGRHRRLGGIEHSKSWKVTPDGRIKAVVTRYSEIELNEERLPVHP